MTRLLAALRAFWLVLRRDGLPRDSVLLLQSWLAGADVPHHRQGELRGEVRLLSDAFDVAYQGVTRLAHTCEVEAGEAAEQTASHPVQRGYWQGYQRAMGRVGHAAGHVGNAAIVRWGG